MPQPIRSNPLTILPLIKAKLVTEEIFGADATDGTRIRDTIDDTPEALPILTAPQDVFLRFGQETPDRDFFHGNGRYDRRTMRLLRITARTRKALDRVGSDTQFLTHTTGNHLLLENRILDALDEWTVTDADLNTLTTGPLEYVGIEPPRRLTTTLDWGYSVILFEIPFTRDLTQLTAAQQS